MCPKNIQKIGPHKAYTHALMFTCINACMHLLVHTHSKKEICISNTFKVYSQTPIAVWLIERIHLIL